MPGKLFHILYIHVCNTTLVIWFHIHFKVNDVDDIFLTAKKVFPKLISKSLGHWFSLMENDHSP